MNHAFENGNKRTALVSMLISLEKNGVWLVDTSEDDLFSVATRTADHDLGDAATDDEEVSFLATWLQARTRTRESGEQRMRFRDLKKLLEEHGCTFEKPNRNFIKIRRDTLEGSVSVKAGYPNEHHEVPRGEIRRIRRALQLDAGEGVDSDAFYSLEESVDSFANKYRQLLNRLADR